ncbi:hypothetical protein SNE40_016250 [Patella caerulea]|uniref:BHLH domain-containing protein n=1 Tax=Patella caerulea TaxID=87958 RepID=A0AAN8PBV3_PATCE
MSLSVGPYAQSYPHPGMTHDIYQYQQVRYPEHPDPGYFQNWVLNATQDLPVGQEHHYIGGGTPSPTDYHHPHHHHHYGQYDPTVPHRHVKRKGTANKKERRRTLSINSAFSNLRGCIPNVPTDTKLSKIKTLRLATSYITYLMDVLSKDDPTLTEAGFKADLSKKPSPHSNNTNITNNNINNIQKQIKKESEGESDSGSSSGSVCGSLSDDKKNNVNGRTGWPQHVWAAELKQ